MIVHADPTRQELTAWWESYVDIDRQLDLVGHHDVSVASQSLYQHLDYITEWHEPEPLKTIKQRLDERWDQLNKSRGAVILRMRADVGPAEKQRASRYGKSPHARPRADLGHTACRDGQRRDRCH